MKNRILIPNTSTTWLIDAKKRLEDLVNKSIEWHDIVIYKEEISGQIWLEEKNYLRREDVSNFSVSK